MAEDHRRPAEEALQGILLDDPGFLKEIVERVLQEMLEAQMTEHIGAPLPTSGADLARGIATAENPEPCAPGWAR